MVLTTNLYAALDDALLRRILFRITFPDPGRGAAGDDLAQADSGACADG